MASRLRALQAYLFGHNLDVGRTRAELAAAHVPVSFEACRTCPDPCDEGHAEYPGKFSIDRETQLLGNLRPYRRQVIISTGKTDWGFVITLVRGTLAYYLAVAQWTWTTSSEEDRDSEGDSEAAPSTARPVQGIFSSVKSAGLSILNGSHRTVCDDASEQTVLVFPDYKFVTGVPQTHDGARALWTEVLDPTIGRAGKAGSTSGLKSWVLPYACVILLCSHKKVDNRCAISAVKLASALTHSLETHHFAVHTQLEDPELLADAPIEALCGTAAERKADYTRRLRDAAAEEAGDQKRALILKTSHIGGHKFAGNVVIHTPQGSGVWYGRVSTHEVESIVVETILGGKVLAPLLRGGANIARPGCHSLLDW